MDDYAAARMLVQSTVQVRMRYTHMNARVGKAAANALADALFKVLPKAEGDGGKAEAAGA